MKRLQKSSLFRPLIVVACLAFSLYLSVLPRSVHGQTPPEPVTPTVGPEQVSTDSLGALRKTITEDESLDADAKKLAGEQLDAAAAALKNEQRYQQTLQKLKLDAETAVDERARIEQLLAQSPAEFNPSLPPDATRENLQAEVTRAEAEASEASQQRVALEEEIARRTTRRAALPDLVTQSRAALVEVNTQLEAKPPEGEPAIVTNVRKQALRSKRQAIAAELALIEQEGPLYEASARLLTARRDLAARSEIEATRRLDARKTLLTKALRKEAEQQATAARIAAVNADPDMQELADRNSKLSQLNKETVAQLEAATREKDETHQRMEALTADFERLTERAEAAQFTHAIGVLLRSHRTTLPSLDRYYDRLAARQPMVSDLNLQHLDLERERRSLVDLEAAIEAAMKDVSTDSASPDEVREQVKNLLTAQREVLASLTQNMANLLSTLVSLDSNERQLIAEVNRQGEYIAEHVLWVRSTTAISTSDASAIASALGRLGPSIPLGQIGLALLSDAGKHIFAWVVCLGTMLVLILVRSRIRRRLKEIGKVAVKSNATEFRPTLSALLMTAGLAAAGPTLMWFLGWRLNNMQYTNAVLRAFGTSLQLISVLFFSMEFFRQVFRSNGLAVSHFGWETNTATFVRHRLRAILLVSLPLLVVIEFCWLSGDSQLHSTAGRFAFAVMALFQTIILFDLLRPSRVLMKALLSNAKEVLKNRLVTLSGLAAILAPLVLGIAALSGYYYTALELGARIIFTVCLVLGLFVLRALIDRWLLVSYRALAIRRNRERRDAMRREQVAKGQSDIVEVEAVPEIQLSDLNVQTSRVIRLVSMLTLLTGFWLIWAEVLPALNILKRVSWEITTPGVGVTGILTLADVALGLIAVVVTFVAARNLPGLVEIAILQRLPLDAGARYAASTIMRYVIFVVGIVTAFQMVGIGWSSVGWLIAAMSVGLGFGLQEIFANFVSGIILLFERPIRVGDTVTVNDVNGTVTRIRIRATTILDWNNRELIVPNRDFVTGNLVNWTLSNSNLRVVMVVGVAYGSDTQLATKLLYEVAAANPNVLKEPEPLVVFTAFGASSLDFELRCHVPTPQLYRTIAHSLNMAIDQAFRKNNIEIAFPQRDLHLRSVDAGILLGARENLGNSNT
jgi:potassium-dependent mechanosensitive channel